MSKSFIKLNRKFEIYQDNLTPDELAQQSYTSGLLEDQAGLSWDDLLKHRLVVILGEPGSGKSAELKAQQKCVQNTSFFLRLEHLVTEDVTNILDNIDNVKFEKWKLGNVEATFFLDAVDESKIQKEEDFFKALSRVKKAIGISLDRAKFVISSRISEWRPHSDRNVVLENLGLNSEKSRQDDSALSQIKIVTLLPLNSSQVERYANSLNVTNTDQFLSALEEANAWGFAGRPLDVEHLVDYWKDNNHLANFTDLTEYMVSKLLAELPNKLKQDPITAKDARLGAENLAAAVILCRCLKIRVADYGTSADELSIYPNDVLPESWSPVSILALTNRALFDGATYGCLTFHHRYHTEYLAAQWIERLMAKNCPFQTLLDLLFATVDNQLVLRPNMAPITAWLIKQDDAPWRARLCKIVLETSPEIHLVHGDPAALSLDYQRKILSNLVKRYEGRNLVRLNWDRTALAKFANNGLADDINAYLTDTTISEDLRADLLMVVREGKLKSCIPTVLNLFADSKPSENLKTYAVTVVRDAGDLEQRKQLATMCTGQTDFSNRLIGLLCEALFPQAINVKGLLGLLAHSKEMKRQVLDIPYVIKPLLKQELNSATAADLLFGLMALLKTPPLLDNPPFSKRYLCLTSLLLTSLNSLFSSSPLPKAHYAVATNAIEMLELANKYNLVEQLASDQKDGLDSLETALKKHHEFRSHLFWVRVNRYRQKHSVEPYFHNISSYGELIGLSSEDLDWLLLSARQSESLQNRILAFSMCIELVWSEPYFSSNFRLLKCAGANSAMLKLCFQYAWRRFCAPARRFWYQRVKAKILKKWWWQSQLRAVNKHYVKLKDLWWLHRHLDELKEGMHTQTLWHFAHDIGGDSQTQYSGSSWNKLVPAWGKRITEAVKQGCMKAWRKHSADFPHEKSERNSVSYSVVIGLAGLQTEWQAEILDFSKLTDEEVDRAVRFACNELNGLPEWFASLLEARPKESMIALLKAISGEWAYAESLEHVHDVISKLAWMPNPPSVIRQLIVKQLQISDPLNAKILEYALSAILKSDNHAAEVLSQFASTRIHNYKPEQPQWLIWMKTWLQMDAIPAIDYLESELVKFSSDEQTLIVTKLSANLSGRWGEQPKLKHISYLEIPALSRLIPLVYGHVKPKDDIDRANGGVYSPGPRDHAQDFRGFLFESLNRHIDVEVDHVLMKLLNKTEMAEQRDWILHLLDGRKSKRAEDAIWLAKDIRTFSEKFMSEPRSDYQLFRLLGRLVNNIKDEIEASENAANRLQVRAEDREEDLRGFLLKKISDQSNGWFSVTQETEVDLGQKPDLRVERISLNPIPIEIKMANMPAWTLPKLLERLENQLVGQYLRPANVRYGIYVLGNTSQTRKWEVPNSTETINFEELVVLIQARAKEIQQVLPNGVDGIEVIGIDFSDPRKR